MSIFSKNTLNDCLDFISNYIFIVKIIYPYPHFIFSEDGNEEHDIYGNGIDSKRKLKIKHSKSKSISHRRTKNSKSKIDNYDNSKI